MISKLAHLGNGPACDISNLRFDPITARPTIANPTVSAREVFDSGSARTNAQAMPKETSAVRYKLLFNTVLRRLNNGSLSH